MSRNVDVFLFFSQKLKMDEVVIAGISGRLPESNNLEEFWENLINGVDMVTEDDRRWKPGKISFICASKITILASWRFLLQ